MKMRVQLFAGSAKRSIIEYAPSSRTIRTGGDIERPVSAKQKEFRLEKQHDHQENSPFTAYRSEMKRMHRSSALENTLISLSTGFGIEDGFATSPRYRTPPQFHRYRASKPTPSEF
ncbi:hypothetical protein PQR05_36820 [Paraburkholderia sediminicola]|uniref:hypothetical protein n=1 Tax=Paraburkholderia sediminicola TaxID=458836 RepID=UPI0038B9B2F0